MPNGDDRWRKFASRLQQASMDRRGFNVLRVTCIVVDGHLRLWSSPRFEGFEPYNAACKPERDEMMRMLTGEDY